MKVSIYTVSRTRAPRLVVGPLVRRRRTLPNRTLWSEGLPTSGKPPYTPQFRPKNSSCLLRRTIRYVCLSKRPWSNYTKSMTKDVLQITNGDTTP